MRKVLILLVISINILSISCKKDDDDKLKITTIQGIDMENGVYRTFWENNDSIDYVFSGTNKVNLKIYTEEIDYPGTWKREVSLLTCYYDTYSDASNALFFKKDGNTYFIKMPFERVSGNMDELVGEYKAISNFDHYEIDDLDSEINSLLQISEDGSYSVTSSIDNSIIQSGTWTEDDIKNGNSFFVDYKDKHFVVLKDLPLFKKQE